MTKDLDVLVIGAGFGGMYLLKRLREAGFRALALEAGGGVGGTWYWNRYPGARCDIESMWYSLGFDDDLEQEWDWSERYAAQPELLRYANHVADRFDLRRDIVFDTRVSRATFDEDANRWTLTTETGEVYAARFCVTATGCLSAPNNPKFDGMETFAGQTYHTGRWPHEEVDFTGKRVAVIGTGSSAIQSIPVIARQAAHLTVFQRTANYAVPARNAAMDPEYAAGVKADYKGFREEGRKMFPAFAYPFTPGSSAIASTPEEREAEFEDRWRTGGLSFMGAFSDLMFDERSNATAADFVRGKIRQVVNDPATADLLSPTNIIGCKRLCVDIGYFETYNRPNVSLVDVSETPVERITPEGVVVNGETYEVDAIVYATGFDAMTGALLRIDMEGVGGRKLSDKWRDGARSYLGLALEGFPNLFMVTGPGSPSVLTNMIPSIEQHVEWISACIEHMRETDQTRIEATGEAEDAWVAHNRDVADANLRSTCSSWYVGANVPGKPRVFMPYIGGFPAYVEKCQEVVANDYEGFQLT